MSCCVTTIDFSSYTLHLNEPPVQNKTPLTESSDFIQITANDQLLVLPPREETVFLISCRLPKHTVGLISPASQLRDKYQLSGAHSNSLVQVSDHNTVPFRILNPHPFAILLYSNTVLGEIEISVAISSIEPVSHATNPVSTTSTSTSNVKIDFDLSNSNLSQTEKEELRESLSQYSDLFANNSNDSGRTSLISHSIVQFRNVSVRIEFLQLIRTQYRLILICHNMIYALQCLPGAALLSLSQRKMVELVLLWTIVSSIISQRKIHIPCLVLMTIWIVWEARTILLCSISVLTIFKFLLKRPKNNLQPVLRKVGSMNSK